MTNSKNTKHALLMSVLSVMLCMAMLVGSTFAWFTDSVTSGKNIIKAGNLGISATVHELVVSGEDALNWTDESNPVTVFCPSEDFIGKNVMALGFSESGVDFENNPDFMSDELFEPGKTFVKMIRVKNDGSLAAKIKAHFKVTDGGLQDALWFALATTDGVQEIQLNRQPMSGLNEALNTLSDLVLMSDGEIDIIFAYGMNEDAGIEYQGKFFEASMSILATQYTYEDDSFDDQYDKDAWAGAVDTSWYTGDLDATEYTLGTPDQVAGLAQLVNAGTTFSGKTIILDKDINLNGIAWSPIGNKEQKIYFEGIFDGNNKTISGLNISGGDYVALFGAVQNAVIQNLTVKGAVSGENGAGVVARMESGTVKNCESYVTVTTTGKAGGIVCLANTYGCVIENCQNYGTVNGTSVGTTGGAGGIVAYANPHTQISNCHNYGDIGTAADKYAGGIVGYGTTNLSSISNCTNSGVITGKNNAGGIIGIATDAWTLTECINIGSVNGGDTASSGGIAGSVRSGRLESCKNTATVSGQYAGGIVGITGGSAEIVNCSGGTAAITSPAFTLGFTGHAFTLELQANDSAGRLIGANNGGGPDAWTKLTIDDSNGDDYSNICAVGICGYTTNWANLEIVSGTLYGNPVAGNKTYIKINEGVMWDDRVAGTYECGGLDDISRIEEWTKNNG